MAVENSVSHPSSICPTFTLSPSLPFYKKILCSNFITSVFLSFPAFNIYIYHYLGGQHNNWSGFGGWQWKEGSNISNYYFFFHYTVKVTKSDFKEILIILQAELIYINLFGKSYHDHPSWLCFPKDYISTLSLCKTQL